MTRAPRSARAESAAVRTAATAGGPKWRAALGCGGRAGPGAVICSQLWCVAARAGRHSESSRRRDRCRASRAAAGGTRAAWRRVCGARMTRPGAAWPRRLSEPTWQVPIEMTANVAGSGRRKEASPEDAAGPGIVFSASRYRSRYRPGRSPACAFHVTCAEDSRVPP